MTEITPALGLSAYFLGRRIAGQRKRTPVAYLYNGVRLPKLPEWDREAYPYAYIHHGSFFNAQLYLSSVPLTYKAGSTGYLYATADGIGVNYVTPREGTSDKWVHYKDVTFVAGDEVFGQTFTKLIWANMDVGAYTDGTLYLTASEPVPVYE